MKPKKLEEFTHNGVIYKGASQLVCFCLVNVLSAGVFAVRASHPTNFWHAVGDCVLVRGAGEKLPFVRAHC